VGDGSTAGCVTPLASARLAFTANYRISNLMVENYSSMGGFLKAILAICF
jgi:hypothetical protein